MNPQVVTQFIGDLMPAFEADDAGSAEKTTEHDNAALVRDAYFALSRGDLEGFRALLAEEVELQIAGHPDSPITGRWKGRDEVIDGAARNYARLEDQRPQMLSVLAQGDMVAVIGWERGRIRATGREYETPWMHLFTIRNGRIARVYGFADSHAMIEAARS